MSASVVKSMKCTLHMIMTALNSSTEKKHKLLTSVIFSLQLHIVHMKQQYTDLTTALSDPEGVAVLGFFYQVTIFNPILMTFNCYFKLDLRLKKTNERVLKCVYLHFQVSNSGNRKYDPIISALKNIKTTSKC